MFCITGKENYPSLSFFVICDHFRKVLYVGNGCFGASSDKTIANNDPMLKNFINGAFRKIQYVLYNEDGVPCLCGSPYLITDNGFPEWSFLQPPDKNCITRDAVLWSEWMESVRKDVECFFGVLKARFRFLRNPVEYNLLAVDAAFKTCCVLHNMLLAWDGLDGDELTREDFWNALDPDSDTDDELYRTPSVHLRDSATRENVIDFYHLQQYKEFIPEGTNFYGVTRDVLSDHLQTHFKHQYRIGDLWWPKGFGRDQRDRMRIPDITLRASRELAKCLYVKKSEYVSFAGEDVGLGLFSTITFGINEDVVSFIGDIIDETERLHRIGLGQTGYMIRISAGKYLDCYKYRRTCKASMANDWHRLTHRLSGTSPTGPNIKVVVSSTKNSARIVTTSIIRANTEMLWDYEIEYWM